VVIIAKPILLYALSFAAGRQWFT